MFFDNSPANGQAEAGAFDFAVGHKGIEKLVDDFGGNSVSIVPDFREHFGIVGRKAKTDLAATGHGINRVGDEVVKDAAEPTGVDRDFYRGRWSFEGNRHALDVEFRLKFLHERFDVRGVVGVEERHVRGSSLCEIEDVVDQIRDALDLLFHAATRNLAHFRGGAFAASGIGGDADDRERIL